MPGVLDHQRALLAQVADRQAQRSRDYAADARLYASMQDAWDPADAEDAVLELAGTARVGQAKAGRILTNASRLVTLFRQVLAQLETGAMRTGTAEIVLYETRHCTEPVCTELDRRLAAELAGLDAADARRLIVRTIVQVEAELDLEQAKRRHAQAKADRGVWIRPDQDGMCQLGARLDVLAARRFELDLAELVRAQQVLDDRDGVARTKAQRQADVLAELPSRHLALLQALRDGKADVLLAEALARTVSDSIGPTPAAQPGPGGPGAAADSSLLSRQELAVQVLRLPVQRPATIYVHVPMSTLLELDQRAAHVEGLGPVHGFHARLLLPHATLQRLAVDGLTGMPQALDPTLLPPLPSGPVVPLPRFSWGSWEFSADPPADLDAGPPADWPPDPVPEPPDDLPGEPPGPPPGPPLGPGPARPGGPSTPNRAPAQRRSPAPPAPAPVPLLVPSTPAEAHRARLLTLALGTLDLREQAEPQHDPSRRLRRFVQLRDLTCTGIGCTRTAQACDLDHERPYQPDQPYAAPTAPWNLSAKSRRCHLAKHDGWIVTRHDTTGISTWQSPSGSSYQRRPAWQPLVIPPDAQLPDARLETLPFIEPPNYLHLPGQFTQLPKPEQASTSDGKPARRWDDDEPPPF